jgi:hypothetical protein
MISLFHCRENKSLRYAIGTQPELWPIKDIVGSWPLSENLSGRFLRLGLFYLYSYWLHVIQSESGERCRRNFVMGNKSTCRGKRKLTKASQKKKIQQLESIYSARGILNFRDLQGNHIFASSSSLQHDDGLDMPGGEDLSPHFQEADDMQDGGNDDIHDIIDEAFDIDALVSSMDEAIIRRQQPGRRRRRRRTAWYSRIISTDRIRKKRYNASLIEPEIREQDSTPRYEAFSMSGIICLTMLL